MEALLFDLDGCIVDSLASIVRCWTETLPGFGLPVPDPAMVRAHVGPPLTEAAASFAPQADAGTRAQIVADYRARSARARDVKPFPGVAEVLDSLHRRGVVLGLATSKSIEVVEPLLEHLGLRRLFQVVEGTRVNEPGTDKATIVGRALAGLAPLVPAALVGDRQHDVAGAHAHGLLAVGVLWGYGSAAELAGAGADVTVTYPDQLEQALSSLTQPN